MCRKVDKINASGGSINVTNISWFLIKSPKVVTLGPTPNKCFECLETVSINCDHPPFTFVVALSGFSIKIVLDHIIENVSRLIFTHLILINFQNFYFSRKCKQENNVQQYKGAQKLLTLMYFDLLSSKNMIKDPD